MIINSTLPYDRPTEKAANLVESNSKTPNMKTPVVSGGEIKFARSLGFGIRWLQRQHIINTAKKYKHWTGVRTPNTYLVKQENIL